MENALKGLDIIAPGCGTKQTGGITNTKKKQET